MHSREARASRVQPISLIDHAAIGGQVFAAELFNEHQLLETRRGPPQYGSLGECGPANAYLINTIPRPALL
jgi:hypothetical protein